MHIPRITPFACIPLLALALTAQAQTAATPAPAAGASATAPAAPAASSSSSGDEVVSLQAFNVTGDAAHGYVASESTTGTRIASKIQDLPFAVNVVTSDFMNDFQEYNINDQLGFVAGFSPSEVLGQFQLRGFQVPTVLVDGFRHIGLNDIVDLDRIEVIMGPDASIYGATQPGGIVNYITKQPTTTQTDHIEIGGGTDGFYRAAFSSSGPAGNSGKVFYRIDAGDQTNQYGEEFASRHISSVAFKLLYKPDDNTSLEISLDHQDVYEHPFNQVLTVTEKQTMPWAGNGVTESQYYGMTVGKSGLDELLNYDFAGPQSTETQRVDDLTATFQHQNTEAWSTKLTVNAYKNPETDQLVGSGAYYPYGTGNVTVVNGVVQQAYAPEVKDQPEADFEPQRGGGMQLDDLFTFSTGPVNNKLLITADYFEVTQKIVSLIPLVNGSQATDYYGLYSPYSAAGAPYYTPGSSWNPATLGYGWNTTLYSSNPSLYNGITEDQYVASGDYGLFGSERASLFKDRLILMMGGRFDSVRNQVRNYNINAATLASASSYEPEEPLAGGAAAAPYQSFDYNTQAWTYQLGATFKLTDGLNLYANKSSAFDPQPQIDSYTGLPLPNNTSNGWEYGLKASFLQQRLNFTLDRFEITENDILQSETDPVTGDKDSILINQEQAHGYELNFNYQVTNNLIWFGDWGYTDAKITQSDVLTFLTDLPARRVPRDNVGTGLRYQISGGALKGLYFIADMKYYSKSLVNLGSGKSLIPGPIGTSVGGSGKMYYDAATNETYLTNPNITGETSLSTLPFNNVPFPGSGILPIPGEPANAVVSVPIGSNGQPLPQTSTPGVYAGEPAGVFVDDGRENNYNAPAAIFDVGMGYGWKWNDGLSNKVRVTAKNLFNREYTWASGVPGNPFQIVATYTLDF